MINMIEKKKFFLNLKSPSAKVSTRTVIKGYAVIIFAVARCITSIWSRTFFGMAPPCIATSASYHGCNESGMWYAFTVCNIHTSTHCYYMLHAMQNACMSRIQVIKLPSDDDSFFSFYFRNPIVLIQPRKRVQLLDANSDQESRIRIIMA